MDREQRIRERAHCIWEEEGRPSGKHQEHWQRACSEIDTETHSSKTGIPDVAPSPGGNRAGATQSNSNSGNSVTGSGLGSDNLSTGVPDAMAVDDLKVAGKLNDPKADRPSTGRSKLVGT